MGNLTHLTLNKILNGLTQPARKCPPNPTLNRYRQALKKDIHLNIYKMVN